MKPLPHQEPPSGDWRVWEITGDRGSGKSVAVGLAVADLMRAHPDCSVLIVGGAITGEAYRMLKDELGDAFDPERVCRISTKGVEVEYDEDKDLNPLRGLEFGIIWLNEVGAYDDMLDRLGLVLRQSPGKVVISNNKASDSERPGLVRSSFRVEDNEFLDPMLRDAVIANRRKAS